jgi:cathepsin L
MLGMNVCENETPISAVEQSFITHMAEQGLSYATQEEYAFRLDIFTKKDAELAKINSNPELTYTVAHNFFSTMTPQEIAKWEGDRPEDFVAVEPTILPEDNLLGAVDWRSKMNSVKNQGSCGSCWAFSATQTIEGHHAIKTGTKVVLSEQQLVDCVYSRSGCDGGSHHLAQTWVQSHGQMKSADYPYHAKYSGSCKHSSGSIKVTHYHGVTSGSRTQMKAALAHGPVSVSIGTGTPIHHYHSGILNDKSCPTHTTHAVGVVGYGDNYWIMRNSWGSSWGEHGYARIAIQDGVGICAIQSKPDWSDTN